MVLIYLLPLTDLNFFPFLQGDNHQVTRMLLTPLLLTIQTVCLTYWTFCIFQHYNMVMAAAASASEDHDLLLSRFLPYGSSQLFLDPPSTPVSSALPPISVNGSSAGGLVSSGSLRESLGHPPAPRPTSESGPTSALYGPIPDVISLDWHRDQTLTWETDCKDFQTLENKTGHTGWLKGVFVNDDDRCRVQRTNIFFVSLLYIRLSI